MATCNARQVEKLREQWGLNWVVLEMLPAVLVSRELREQWTLDWVDENLQLARSNVQLMSHEPEHTTLWETS